jgi:glucose-1-phosphate adenylyltransferase
LWDDHARADSSHDFGKDILPRLVAQGKNVFAFPYNGYWVDVGTVNSYWQAHMDLLTDNPPLDLNDRSWIIHTRTEERPPRALPAGRYAGQYDLRWCVIAPGRALSAASYRRRA